MTQLSDTINRHVQEALTKEGFDPRALAPKVWEELDEDSRSVLGIEGIIRRMKQAAKVLTSDALQRLGSKQIELPFRIDGAVVVDVEDRRIRLTESLNQLEFARAIEIRKKQIKDDQAQLKEWESAERIARPYWRDHPDWTFGQCVKAIAKDFRAKNRRAA